MSILRQSRQAHVILPSLLVNQSVGFLFADVAASASSRTPVILFKGCQYISISLLSRLLTWIVYSLQLGFHLSFFGSKYQRLLIVSNPPFAPLIASVFRRPYSLLLYDLYPQVLCQLNPSGSLQRIALTLFISLWGVFNRFTFSKAKTIITLTDEMALELKPSFPTEEVWRSKVLVIPPWADTSNLFPDPAAAQDFKQKFNLDPSRLLVSYSGNFGLTHPLEPLLVAGSDLELGNVASVAQILLIGKGAKLSRMRSISHDLSLRATTLRFLERLSEYDFRGCLSASDIAVVAIDGHAAAASLPSKVFSAMACGTPIMAIAPSSSALANLISKHKCGIVVEPSPSAGSEIASILMELSIDNSSLKGLSQNSLAASFHYTSANSELIVDAWLDS
jgi:glycosyltransferase involved in cell wall biosynthesis